MTRAVSTAVDVAVFLVLVSAATLTVATVQPADPTPPPRTDAAAFVVGTATATVEYQPATSAGGGNATGPNASRVAHGTVAGLLADAAFATATVDERPLTPRGAAFERAVRAATRARLPDEGVQVVATWRPVPGGDVAGRTAVGPSPPPDADVSAATLTVGVPGDRTAPGNGSFRDVAAAVARAVVRARFPPTETAATLRARSNAGATLRRRYHHAATVLGVDVAGPLRRGDVAAANRRLAAALSPRLADDLRRRFDDPEAAARAVAVDRVRVTVRRWSR